MKDIAAIVLAAGQSKRMKTRTPKILHRLMGKPMIEYVLDAVRGAGVKKIVLVIGHEKEKIIQYLGDNVTYAFQNEQLGTGHAVMQAMPSLGGFSGDVLITCGDMPLLSSETLNIFIRRHRETGSRISLLTAVMENPGNLGRIKRNASGCVQSIIEAADATFAELEIKEVNTGTYLFDSDYLSEILSRIGMPNAQNEIYLTDTITISNEVGQKVEAVTCADWRESLGVNDRADLAEAEAVIRGRINLNLMKSGVTIHDPTSTYIESTVKIENDTEIMPGCIITGKTIIGRDCVIGPGAHIDNSIIGCGVRIKESVISESEIGEGTTIGPFAHVRPGTVTGKNVKIGNFVEIKKSSISDGSKISHLSYIGDTTMGAKVNIGAGTITCNYDGKKKNPTTIKDGAFIGSNSSLVAPVVIGEGSVTGAGSVVTKNIPDHKLAVGLPARVIKSLTA